MSTISNRLSLLVLLCCVLFMSGCSTYSFTGASIAPDIKTVSIQYFPNYASLVQPMLSQTLTEKLKDKFLRQTQLSLVKTNGDLNFEGSIVEYISRPSAIQSEQSALSRLSIRVKIIFTNTKDNKQNYDFTFEQFADYPSSKTLTEEENRLIDEITDKLVDDIFNKAVVNW